MCFLRVAASGSVMRCDTRQNILPCLPFPVCAWSLIHRFPLALLICVMTACKDMQQQTRPVLIIKAECRSGKYSKTFPAVMLLLHCANEAAQGVRLCCAAKSISSFVRRRQVTSQLNSWRHAHRLQQPRPIIDHDENFYPWPDRASLAPSETQA